MNLRRADDGYFEWTEPLPTPVQLKNAFKDIERKLNCDGPPPHHLDKKMTVETETSTDDPQPQ